MNRPSFSSQSLSIASSLVQDRVFPLPVSQNWIKVNLAFNVHNYKDILQKEWWSIWNLILEWLTSSGINNEH